MTKNEALCQDLRTLRHTTQAKFPKYLLDGKCSEKKVVDVNETNISCPIRSNIWGCHKNESFKKLWLLMHHRV
jgi:hypothetical protein